MQRTRVIILGGGLTGLSTAYRLAARGIDFLMLESSDRVGGVIKTVHKNGFTYEAGPNTGILGTPELVELIEDLGDEVELQVGAKAVHRRLILKNGKWQALPSGLVSAITTPLFSLKDKFRILGEPFRRKGRDPNETLDKLVLRRMGKSFLDFAIDPFILGVYSGDPSLLVTRMAFPKLYALEQNYGSFIGGTIKKKREGKSPREAKATREVFSFKNGLESFTRALEKGAGIEKILKSVGPVRISKAGSGFIVETAIGDKEIKIQADMVISTLNSPHLKPEMVPFIDTGLLDAVQAVKYAPAVEVVLGFKKWEGRPLDAFGGLIPHKEGRELLGILFLSAFLPERAPEGGALLTVFMGGVRNSKWIDASDELIKSAVRQEVTDLMDLKSFEPELFSIYRHKGAIPQYSFESDAKMKAIEEIEKIHPGFLMGGNALDGIGIADRVKQGTTLANRAIKLLEDK